MQTEPAERRQIFMNQLLYNYDIYPKVFPVGKPVEITIRGLGEHALFSGGYR